MTRIGADVPKCVPADEGMKAARQPDGMSPTQFFEQRAANVPLVVQGEIPRRVSLLARAAACGGSFISAFGSAWLAVSLLLMVVAIAMSSRVGWEAIVFTGLFVAVGGFLFWIGISRGLTAVKLVTHGHLTWALVNHVARQTSTSTDSEGRTRTSVSYRVSFMYRPEGDEVLFAEAVLTNADRVRDDKQELLLYDPANHTRVEFADLLPGGLRINEMGEATESGTRNLLSLLPFVVVPLGPLFGLLILPQFLA